MKFLHFPECSLWRNEMTTEEPRPELSQAIASGAPRQTRLHQAIKRLTIQRLARLGGVLALLLIVWLSLIPGDMQTRTPLPKQGEHFIAYFFTAIVLAFALQHPRKHLFVACSLSLFAGVLELAQAFIPGRTAGIGDLAASCAGAVAGVVLASTIVTILLRKWGDRGGPQAGAK